MKKQAVIYEVVSTPFVLSDESKRLYRKELIYVGNFVKGKQRFSVDEVLLHHWARTHKDLIANGVTVPLPLDHSESAEANRGEILDMEVGVNGAGLPALFGIVKFRDAEAEKMAKSANISIYVPPEFKDGKNNVYVRPIRHAALTDYPVIPGLQKFQAIAASFEGEMDMEKLRALAKKLGVGDDVPDDGLLAAMEARIDELVDDEEEEGEGEGEGEGEDEGEGEGGGERRGPIKEETKKYHPVSASFISIAKRDRVSRLNTLVREGRITSAVGKELAKKYCSDKQVKLVLSHVDEKTEPDDFESVIMALSLNEPQKHMRGETSGPQTEELLLSESGTGGGGKGVNHLLKDAERRAEEAKAARRR